MDVIIKVNNQTAGRDKLARLLQYLSRFLWHRLQRTNKDSAANIKNLEYQLSTFRKLLRFGRFAESLYTALPLFRQEDATVRYTVILSKIANSLFLLADHILWLGRADLCAVDTDKWGRISNKYWLYSITMSLVRDFYEIFAILKIQKSYIIPKSGVNTLNDVLRVLISTYSVIKANPGIVIDTVKNGCDFFIPLTALGYMKMSSGTVGLLGVLSSVAGLLVLLDPQKKLYPS